MKKQFLLLAGALILLGFNAHAQVEPAITYYSPKNYVVLDFTYSVESHETGPYAPFAEEMLGIQNVVTENETIHTLENVFIAHRTDVDLSRPHIITAQKGLPTQFVSINEQGLLVGFNTPVAVPENKRTPKHNHPKPCHEQPSAMIAAIPEEVMEAGTPKAQADALAKHIFRIRETRMYLLSGEVEHSPADGASMACVLQELDKQEQTLTALFTGHSEIKKVHKEIVFCPAQQAEAPYTDTLFFSAENGFTDAENIDAERIIIRAEYQKPTVAKADNEKRKKDAVEPSQIVYNTPGYACVRVYYKGEELNKRTMPIAQLGVDVPLAKDLFTGNQLPVIVFSEQTGNIVSISK
ncbi:MAG: DUF4831 family protein [Paludibacteraceae bacterium]|nr:DUF4831 family protein [Paludibacteraceae bacterium]